MSPRDVIQLCTALQALVCVKQECMAADDETLRQIGDKLDLCAAIRDRIQNEVSPDAPLMVNRGG